MSGPSPGYVLDASAMLAYLLGEPGADVVEEALQGGACAAHALSLCEVFYRFHRTQGEAAAQAALAGLLGDGIEPNAELDTELWQAAGRVKSRHHRLVSLADARGMSLAARLGWTFLTGDRFELEPIASALPAPLRFIR